MNEERENEGFGGEDEDPREAAEEAAYEAAMEDRFDFAREGY